MSYKRPQRHRQDINQGPLVKLFLELGGVWVPYANKPFDGWGWHPKWSNYLRRDVNPGLPACGFMPIEIKRPEREGHANEYTWRQKKVLHTLQIAGATWMTWREPADVYRAVGAHSPTNPRTTRTTAWPADCVQPPSFGWLRK